MKDEMFKRKQLFLIGLTFFAFVAKSYSQEMACPVYLQQTPSVAVTDTLISQRYLAHPGPRGAFGLEINNRSNRVLVRDLMSEALAPIFAQMSSLNSTDLEQTQS
jgi:hypothetical protein